MPDARHLFAFHIVITSIFIHFKVYNAESVNQLVYQPCRVSQYAWNKASQNSQESATGTVKMVVVVVALLFYVHSKHLRSCRDGQLT